MRTKVLAFLTAAAMAAGVASSQAQVYSQNVVGYVNVTCSNLFTLIQNPLDDGAGNYVSNVLASAPLGSVIYTFNGTNFALNTLDLFGGGWSSPSDSLPPGKGFFILNPNGAGSAFTLTFVGNVLQGSLSTTLNAGVYTVAGSKVPIAGFMGDLGYAGSPGDAALRWANAWVVYSDDLFGGGWSSTKPGDTGYDVNKGPYLGVAESVFYNNQAGYNTNWVYNFTVQP